MPRIRTIKPEFWADEKVAPLDPISRLVFLGLISMADDCGRLVDNLKQIDAFIFPETNDTSREALENLARISRVKRGNTPSGQKIIQIVNWETHQKIDHPNFKAALPEIVDVKEDAEIRESLANDSRNILEDSRPDLRPTTYDLRPGASFNSQEGAMYVKQELNLTGQYIVRDVSEALDVIHAKEGLDFQKAAEVFVDRWRAHQKTDSKLGFSSWLHHGDYTTGVPAAAPRKWKVVGNG
jgi:hypothetical protein